MDLEGGGEGGGGVQIHLSIGVAARQDRGKDGKDEDAVIQRTLFASSVTISCHSPLATSP